MIGVHSVTVTGAAVQADAYPNADFDDGLTGWTPLAGTPAGWAVDDAGAHPGPGAASTGRVGLVGATLYAVDPAWDTVEVSVTYTATAPGTLALGWLYGDPNAATGTQVWNTYLAMVAGQTYSTTIEVPDPGQYAALTPAFRFTPNPVVDVQASTLAELGMRARVDSTVDVSCLVDSVTIRLGREDTDSQPEASSATLELSTDTADTDIPPELEVGAIVQVYTTLGGLTSTRFAGRITDISFGWEDAGEETPDRLVAQIIATGPLAELGRRVVGDTPWPQQLDGERIAAIMTVAGIDLDPLTSDPGTVQVLPRDVDSQPALDVAQSTAESAGGTVWATRAGDIRYADAEHRRGTTPALEMDACDILVTPTWRRTTEGLINKVSIGYGPTPEEGEQPRYISQRDDSISEYGRFEFTAATELAELADAEAMGELLLTRNRVPVWVMSDLPVDVEGLTLADTQILLGLEMHDLITLAGLPAAGTVPTTANLWVEGWTETLAAGLHDLELVVSGYCRTSPPARWNDVPAEWTWDTIQPASMTWDDATCFGPLPNKGRWDDVPASLRWDQIPATTTWDTWTGAA